MTRKRVRPITKAFIKRSLAPFKYLAFKITLTNNEVIIVSFQNACTIVGYESVSKFVLLGATIAIPGRIEFSVSCWHKRAEVTPIIAPII